jgi:hypothetical protein
MVVVICGVVLLPHRLFGGFFEAVILVLSVTSFLSLPSLPEGDRCIAERCQPQCVAPASSSALHTGLLPLFLFALLSGQRSTTQHSRAARYEAPLSFQVELFGLGIMRSLIVAKLPEDTNAG